LSRSRQVVTALLISLMIDIDSYCWSRVERPVSSPRGKSACVSFLPFRFFGFGIGVTNSAFRRVSTMACVGWPSLSSSQWRAGAT